jgi:hypothetical protein
MLGAMSRTAASALLAVSILAALAPGGCASEPGEADGPMDGGPDGGVVDGTQSFNQMIRPLVTLCVTCHSAGTNEPNLTSYLALGARYRVKPGATNILVTKADASGGVHYGYPYFDFDQKKVVAKWIDSLP